MMRCGNIAYIPELKKLWKECFEDEDAYINAFFEAFYKDENVLLAEENGVLMGASFFLPGKIYLCPQAQLCSESHRARQRETFVGIEENWQDIRYVYALATYPQFRGCGIAGGLLRYAHAHYHVPLIAEPAEEGLVSGFYEPLGFCASFYLERKQIEIPQVNLQAAEVRPAEPNIADWQAKPIDAEQYYKIRECHFRKNGYISWLPAHIAFAIEEHRESGGDALLITRAGREDFLLYYREEGQIVVTETTLAQEEVIEFFAVYLLTSGSCLIIRSACELDRQQQWTEILAEQDSCRELVGMSYGLPSMHGYLNLSLD